MSYGGNSGGAEIQNREAGGEAGLDGVVRRSFFEEVSLKQRLERQPRASLIKRGRKANREWHVRQPGACTFQEPRLDSVSKKVSAERRGWVCHSRKVWTGMHYDRIYGVRGRGEQSAGGCCYPGEGAGALE